jgi:hypothetical protein
MVLKPFFRIFTATFTRLLNESDEESPPFVKVSQRN